MIKDRLAGLFPISEEGRQTLVSQGVYEQLAQHVTALSNLRLRGLMTILNQTANSAASYNSVAQLAARIRTGLSSTQGQHWDTLSMGMSGDIEAAILAGATHVRIGTALFGPRTA